jgi:hypothetical protein
MMAPRAEFVTQLLEISIDRHHIREDCPGTNGAPKKRCFPHQFTLRLYNMQDKRPFTSRKCVYLNLYKLALFKPSNIFKQLFLLWSRVSSVDIALGYGMDDMGSRLQFPAGAANFSLRHRVQNGSGAHPASYPIVYQGLFPWG